MRGVLIHHIRIEREDIDFTSSLRMKNKEYVDRAEDLISKALMILQPKAYYRRVEVGKINKDGIEVEGITLNSRILSSNTENNQEIFPYVATCGREIEDWQKPFTDPLDVYYINKIQEMACVRAVDKTFSLIQESYGLHDPSNVNPGSLDDWSIEEQKKLFQLMENPQKELGMELTENCLMIPIKSLSGILFQGKEKHINCEMCKREDCPNRRIDFRAPLK